MLFQSSEEVFWRPMLVKHCHRRSKCLHRHSRCTKCLNVYLYTLDGRSRMVRFRLASFRTLYPWPRSLQGKLKSVMILSHTVRRPWTGILWILSVSSLLRTANFNQQSRWPTCTRFTAHANGLAKCNAVRVRDTLRALDRVNANIEFHKCHEWTEWRRDFGCEALMRDIADNRLYVGKENVTRLLYTNRVLEQDYV